MSLSGELRDRLAAAHAEALQVGDSPLRADRLADRLAAELRGISAAPLTDEQRSRIRAALENAERVLRRDDDGREAARHLQGALGQLEERARKPSPFLDDPPS